MYLEGIGRKVFPVAKDGQCMFSSLSHQLFGLPNRSYDVRSLLVRFESNNQQKFSPFLMEINSPDMHSHIQEMLHPKKWGTHVELLAAATYFQIPVYFLKSPSSRFKWEVLHPLGSASSFRWYQLCPEVDSYAEDISVPDHFEVLLSSECHYDSIICFSGGVCTTRPNITYSHFHNDSIIE